MAKQSVCDECGTVRPVDQFGGYPAGWVVSVERVAAGPTARYANDAEPVAVCGWRCLLGWATRQEGARAEAEFRAVMERAAAAREKAAAEAKAEAERLDAEAAAGSTWDGCGELRPADEVRGNLRDGLTVGRFGEAGHVRAAGADSSDE